MSPLSYAAFLIHRACCPSGNAALPDITQSRIYNSVNKGITRCKRDVYPLSTYLVLSFIDWLADTLAFSLKKQIQLVVISTDATYGSSHTFLNRG